VYEIKKPGSNALSYCVFLLDGGQRKKGREERKTKGRINGKRVRQGRGSAYAGMGKYHGVHGVPSMFFGRERGRKTSSRKWEANVC